MSTYYTIILFFFYFLLFVTTFLITILASYATVSITIDMVQTIIENLKEYRQKKEEEKKYIDSQNKRLKQNENTAKSNKLFYEALSQREDLDQLFDRHPSLKLDYLRFMKNREKAGI